MRTFYIFKIKKHLTILTNNHPYLLYKTIESNYAFDLLNNSSEFLIIQNPIADLNESQSAIIHIKNTCKNSVFNCYVNCCFGHSVTYNTFLKTKTKTKYLFQSVASIIPNKCSCCLDDNIDLFASFKNWKPICRNG